MTTPTAPDETDRIIPAGHGLRFWLAVHVVLALAFVAGLALWHIALH
jgi:hypothetical protein